VLLHPVMTITDPARAEEAKEIHHRAHAACAIARSMNFPVECEPSVALGA
jgi:organic hydroperoxide reductase OsmC/OhrA